MRKLVIGVGVVVVIIMATAYFVVPNYALKLVKEYKPYTFERVLEDDTMKVNYGIYDNTSPAYYGYPDYSEVTYSSIQDGNRLAAWYVPSQIPSEKTILLIHGRWSNRLKTMKYLELFKASGYDTLYNVMIPDMRNSGKSDPATTMMGYEFAEDIASTLVWLSAEKQQSDVLLFGFSMGAMAVATMLNRDDLLEEIDGKINISAIILDSPVAHVEKILRRGGKGTGLPTFILDRTMELLNEEYNGYPEKMYFGNLLKDVTVPILILQGTMDQSQPTSILKTEVESLNKSNIELRTFEGAEHVRIYQVTEHKPVYTAAVSTFIANNL